jgi:hypothetical protein
MSPTRHREERVKRVKVKVGPDGLGSVTVDGTEIPCTEVEVLARPGEATTVHLETTGAIEADAAGDRSWVQVRDPFTGDVLREGWVDDWPGREEE